ncbi:beta-lactamase protein [Heliomicrobium modesticaldum Ice1]|uniref:Beta-lactamase protein n=1 Tax=Heliobacterium modesticaldum (strain ATCC 51547 / Ice1) TaxID=498761 RepID=B0TA42_HELMI|nr:MBL fold metallo-hydrolase [Heliomicrobium modesticaldum]ABZ83579.1 beta-lactamase protein [Heliomicrobium modesticaldum Ice1]
MRYTTIASGSSGNCAFVEGKQTRLLVDAGLAGKAVEKGLAAVGVDPRTIDAIVVTHEHIDHIRGVGVLARRYKLPVYASEGCWEGMKHAIGDVPEAQVRLIDPNKKVTLKNLEIEAFPTPHDARAPIGMTIDDGDSRLGIATDIGYVTRGMGRRLIDCQGLIFEANYDPKLLQTGPYPAHLKRRIASDKGHLSNPDAGEALVKLCDGAVRQVLLSHLSQENNRPDLAVHTVASILTENEHAVQLVGDGAVALEGVLAVAEGRALPWPEPGAEGRSGARTEQVRLSVAPRYEPHPLEEI